MYNVSMIEHFFFDISSIRNRIEPYGVQTKTKIMGICVFYKSGIFIYNILNPRINFQY